MFKLYFYLLRLEKGTCLKTLWPSQDHWEWHTSWSLPRRPTPLTWWDELIFFSWCKHPVILRDCCTEIYLFLSKPLTCSSWFYLSKKKIFLSFQRLARLPKGPTLHFRVLKVNRANWKECFEQWRRWWQLKSWLFGDVFKVNALMCPNCRHVIRTFSLFFFF